MSNNKFDLDLFPTILIESKLEEAIQYVIEHHKTKDIDDLEALMSIEEFTNRGEIGAITDKIIAKIQDLLINITDLDAYYNQLYFVRVADFNHRPDIKKMTDYIAAHTTHADILEILSSDTR
ncbi:hypothetical protein [Deinococcus sp. QL22]|uniref:hypothetical protein n=1 Tax=Deinococcus sp. QL22 TaxID=2939437 RepID=UPI002016D2B4|nr:hypothetical protein [Deinococcus sp. QL22]UQN10559.1 hypothetical protein M1R55_30625 [Deinococcus sp. QL22]